MKKLYLLLFFVSNCITAQLTWSPITTIPTNTDGQRFDDVFFLNENLGWAANGYYSAVYKTTDGGANWTTLIPNGGLGGYYYFRNIEFLNENVGFLGTLSNRFYKTIDGGTTWNQVTNITPNPLAICGLDGVGSSTIYGCGAYFSPAYIIKSTDSGATWQYTDMSAYANALVEVLFLDENIGFASGNNASGALILKTTDGGGTWSTLFNGSIAGEYVWKLQVLPSIPNVIFGSIESVAPNSGKLIKTVDAGLNWTSKNFPDSDVQAVGFVTDTHGWMGGHNTGFYETFDSGDTWANTGVGSNLNRIFFVNDNVAFASGKTIYKMTNLLSTTDFQESPRIPLNVSVSPNPIKDKLNLEIDFNGSDHLVLGLYSITGQLIKQLKLDAIEQAGTKSYTIDFPYPNGVYILNLHTNTGRQSIKITK
jgi:photosystem II stability/assembly factor-like uncharacterized protein